MSDLIPLDKAAKMLGLSPDRLKEMISGNQIFGYRDGASWKFKMQEIERVADELAIDLPGSENQFGAGLLDEAEDDDSLFTLDEGSAELSGSLFDDEDDLLMDDSGTGKPPRQPVAGNSKKSDSDSHFSDSNFDLSDSELLLDDDSDSDVSSGNVANASGSANPNKSSGKKPLGDEASLFGDDDDLLFGDSSLDLALDSGDDAKGNPSASDSVLDDDLLLEDPSGSTGKLLKAMNEKIEDSKDELNLMEDDLFDDDLRLADSDSLEDAIDLSSDFEDSDIVLEDSDSSSELMLESNDDGIELSANDSGISLSDSLELGGSDIDDLELPDDDMISLSNAADADAATLLKEDDFNLTPFEDGDGDDASGSQVIALDDSDLFAGDSEATLLGDNDLVAQPQMLDDRGALVSPEVSGVPVAMEVPYSLWQIISLASTAALLGLGFIVAFDVARNLWMPSDRIANSGLLNLFLQIAGMN